MSKRQARILGNLDLTINFREGLKDREGYSGFAIIMMAVLVFDRANSWLVRFGLGIGIGVWF